MAYFHRFLCMAMMLASSAVVANSNVSGLVIGESDLTSIESEYQITHTAIISNVRKSVYEMPVDQLDPDGFFSRSMPRSATLYLNETSVLSDIHLIYDDWNFSDALDELDSRFGKEPEQYLLYGGESVMYSWPEYTVICFRDRESGYTHILFSDNGS